MKTIKITISEASPNGTITVTDSVAYVAKNQKDIELMFASIPPTVTKIIRPDSGSVTKTQQEITKLLVAKGVLLHSEISDRFQQV